MLLGRLKDGDDDDGDGDDKNSTFSMHQANEKLWLENLEQKSI